MRYLEHKSSQFLFTCQGAKLHLHVTFLGRCQMVTEMFFFFQSPDGKMWSPKSVNKIFPLQ